MALVYLRASMIVQGKTVFRPGAGISGRGGKGRPGKVKVDSI